MGLVAHQSASCRHTGSHVTTPGSSTYNSTIVLSTIAQDQLMSAKPKTCPRNACDLRCLAVMVRGGVAAAATRCGPLRLHPPVRCQRLAQRGGGSTTWATRGFLFPLRTLMYVCMYVLWRSGVSLPPSPSPRFSIPEPLPNTQRVWTEQGHRGERIYVLVLIRRMCKAYWQGRAKPPTRSRQLQGAGALVDLSSYQRSKWTNGGGVRGDSTWPSRGSMSQSQCSAPDVLD